MKFIARTLIVAFALSGAAFAQGPARGRIEPVRDEVMEAQAKHNLDVARYYLTKRKAYEGARDRLQEIMETYPDFSRMDEVLYLLGEANLKLGKKEQAVEFYNKLLKVYPASELVKKARARLEELKGEEVK
ncbi:MAG TPA: outer membrane protein assembly factor BamD [Blastocatellia bacterium]|nr:outer membrane protein assembly factor BamD [Blastocatellia bacterium]